ncbi:AMP-binding protein [Geothrix sp. 21YS21S-4]|uniref:AMP-binding protein n=1 Tax=Geothrix sp. 21YS21S-4 TaxID=3068889 RepID=UPI0027BA813A|nr:AMP-binding protein [Geothrix sp. 21YS21S-4]
MIASLIRALGRPLLRLRYRIQVEGLDALPSQGGPGILFLAAHPTLVDPFLLAAELHGHFAPVLVAGRDHAASAPLRWLARLLGCRPLSDPAQHGERAREILDREIAALATHLTSGGHLVLFPGARLARQKTEDLSDNSTVEALLRQAPGARVVVIHLQGLWGSRFSAASGRRPSVGTELLKGLGYLLANGLFFMPRRDVRLVFEELHGLPLADGRPVLNQALEVRLNAGATPRTFVPYLRGKDRAPRTLPEPPRPRVEGNPRSVPPQVREAVKRHLQALTGRSEIKDEQRLVADLHLDALDRRELEFWIQRAYGYPPGDPAAVQTVGDLLLAATGAAVSLRQGELKAVPPAWFHSRTDLAIEMPDGETIPEVFLKQARRDPRRVVLADQVGGVKTYRDVLTAVLVLKPIFEALEGTHVGLMLPASGGASIIYLALLFAGKTPVLVNWTAGARSMAYGLDLVDVRHVVTVSTLINRLDAQGVDLSAVKPRLFLLDEAGKRIGLGTKLAAAFSARFNWTSLQAARPPATAAVLFTSGSESHPKAVPLSHGNILTNIRDAAQALNFRQDERVMGCLPPFHAFGLTTTTILPLLVGLRVVYHPNPTEGRMLARIIEAYHATLLVGTPTFLGGILRTAEDRHLESLRIVVSGAEKCPDQIYATLARRWPNTAVLEGYGITECSPVVSVNREEDPRNGTIGKPLLSVEWAIVDLESGRRAEPGQSGMLLVRGPSVFSGYLNPDVDSPFETFEGKDWYRTGDLVRQDRGVLVFTGRLKRFVKLGGEMVSLPAIEEALSQKFQGEDETEPLLAVEAMPEELNPDLILFSVAGIARDEANAAIRAAGLSSLHNIRVVRQIDQIPTLGTGKTDYRALKALLADVSA